MADEKYRTQLTGAQVDDALQQLNQRVAEGWAVGTRDGSPVGSGSEYYHNNARYYAQQAQSIAPASVTEAVRWDIAQTALTDANRLQARENINAADNDTSVQVVTQSFTSEQQEIARANIAAGKTNPNLLDNCYFVGGGSQLGYGKFPINQNGQTSYTGSGRMIDRWFGQNNAGGMTLTEDGLVFTNSASGYGYIRHTLTRATQRTGWTLSVLTANGEVYQSSGSGGITLPSGLYLYWASSNALTFRVPANLTASETIVSIKYEAAPYSTILNDTKPDFDRELQKAQAHYLKLVDIALPAIANASGVSLTPFIPTATTMSPTSTVQAISVGWVRKAGYSATPSVSVSNVTTKIFPGFVFLQIAHGLNNITAQDTYWINFSNLQIGDGI